MLAKAKNKPTIVAEIEPTNTTNVVLKKEEYINYTNWMESLKNSRSPIEARFYKFRIELLFKTALLRNQL